VCALPVGPLRDVAVRGVSAGRLESLHRQRSALAATPPDRLAPFLATPPERRREEFLTTLAKLMNDEALHLLLHGSAMEGAVRSGRDAASQALGLGPREFAAVG
jgi:hypothetical protein